MVSHMFRKVCSTWFDFVPPPTRAGRCYFTHKRTKSGESNLWAKRSWPPEYKHSSVADCNTALPPLPPLSSRCFPLLWGNSVFSIKSSNKEFKCPLQHRQCSVRHPLIDSEHHTPEDRGRQEGHSGNSDCSCFNGTKNPTQPWKASCPEWRTGKKVAQRAALSSGYVEGSIGTENSCLDNPL